MACKGAYAGWLGLVAFLIILGGAAPQCPGTLPNRTCGYECQTLICEQLVKFFQTSQTPREKAWGVEDAYPGWISNGPANDSGWIPSIKAGCSKLIQPGLYPPAYCDNSTYFPGISCCTATRQSYLGEPCSYLYTPVNFSMPVNRVNASIEPGSGFLESVGHLVDCGLRTLNLDGNRLSGSFTPIWGTFDGLRQIQLSQNWLGGPMPADFSRLTGLQSLNLYGNLYYGTIPSGWGNMKSLRFLNLGAQASNTGLTGTLPGSLFLLPNLGELNVEQNALGGSLPDGLCKVGDNASGALRVLSLKKNKFSGSATSLLQCSNLTFLQLSGNQFTGELPVSAEWKHLMLYMAANNMFSGTFPAAFYDVPFLAHLDITNNFVEGTLTPKVQMMIYLQQFSASNNRLSGTLPKEIYYLASLSKLSLDNNSFTGSVLSNVGYAQSLAQLRLNNNTDMGGSIPDELGQIPGLERLDLLDTRMSGKLPCWLKQSNDNMLPPPLLQEKQLWLVGLQCPQLERVVDDTCGFKQPEYITGAIEPVWNIDPVYYDYEGCQCISGWTPAWELDADTDRTRMKCRPEALATWSKGIIAAAACLFVVICVLIILFLIKRLTQKSSWYYKKMINKHRFQSIPTEGPFSVVVTDIEGYSELMKASPMLMTKALGLHNHAIRRAMHSNAGHVLEQEGDSYAIAFYDPIEAVAFCLQVQLALQRLDWSEGGLLGLYRGTRGRQGQSSFPDPLDKLESLTSTGPLDSLSSGSTIGGAGLALAADAGTNENAKSWRKGRKLRSTRLLNSFLRSNGRGEDTGNKNNFFTMLNRDDQDGLFNGLRVRMGVATGIKTKQQDIKSTLVWEQAKVISDLGSGGQILMDEPTFQKVKNVLFELGTVDHNGIDFSQLQAVPEALLCFNRDGTKDICSNEAVVLDMGQYEYASMAAAAAAAVVGAAEEGKDAVKGGKAGRALLMLKRSSPSPASEEPTLESLDRLRRLSMAKLKIETGNTSMKVYQVLAPHLLGRAHWFVNKLALPRGRSTCTDLPYFDAPGALYGDLPECVGVAGPARRECSDLSGGNSDPSRDLDLPNITMVFAIMEGGKAFVKKMRKEAEQVQKVMVSTLVRALRAVPGGYLCRVQEGDFKYMVAFCDAQDALEWCLVVQQLLMWQNWPEVLLNYPGMGEVKDSKGRVVFRGPRLKMGVCEGKPRTILPDHLGRADYHGASINQAARYMDAAAHGGMIACEAELAAKVFGIWRGERPADLVGVPASCVFATNAKALQEEKIVPGRLYYTAEEYETAQFQQQLLEEEAARQRAEAVETARDEAVRLSVLMPAAMAAAVATGNLNIDTESSASFKTWDTSGVSANRATAPGAAVLTSMVAANASSAEGAAATATAAQGVGRAEGHKGTAAAHPAPPRMAGPIAEGQESSGSGPVSPDLASSKLVEQLQREQTAAAAAITSEEGFPGTLPSPRLAAVQSIDIPDGNTGTIQGMLAPESLPPLEYGCSDGPALHTPFVTPPEPVETPARGAAAAAGTAGGPGAAARSGSGGVGSQGGARQQQLRTGSFTVIKEGRPMTDASVPYGLGSRQPSITSPQSSSSNGSNYCLQDASFAISPSRLSLSEAGGSEGVPPSLPSNPALQRQPLRLRTPFAIMTQAPSKSQPTALATTRPGNSSGGQDGAAWPYGQVSGSGGSGLLLQPPVSRRGSGTRSSSIELTVQSQLAPVVGSDGSGSWYGAIERPPLVGVRAKMLQTSIRDFLLVGGYEQTPVEAVCIGIWKFKGNPAPLQMVHVTCGDMRARTFDPEPPKGKGNRLSEQGAGEVLQRATIPLSDVASQARDQLDLTLRTAAALLHRASMERTRPLQTAGKAAAALLRKANSMRADASATESPGGDSTDDGTSSAAEWGEAGARRTVTFAHSKSMPAARSGAGGDGPAAAGSSWRQSAQREGRKNRLLSVGSIEEIAADNKSRAAGGAQGRAAAAAAAAAVRAEQLA